MNSILTILAIEDDEVDIEALQRALKKSTYSWNLITAPSGEEALSFLKENQDVYATNEMVVLLDLNMPRMNGVDFLREIRSNEKLKDLDVIVLSTSDYDKDRETVEKLGVNYYFVKTKISSSFTEVFEAIVDVKNKA